MLSQPVNFSPFLIASNKAVQKKLFRKFHFFIMNGLFHLSLAYAVQPYTTEVRDSAVLYQLGA